MRVVVLLQRLGDANWECKLVLNKVRTVPWCHAVVHFDEKMRRVLAVFQDNPPDGEGAAPSTWPFFRGHFQCVQQDQDQFRS